jgi:hypothetical protein
MEVSLMSFQVLRFVAKFLVPDRGIKSTTLAEDLVYNIPPVMDYELGLCRLLFTQILTQIWSKLISAFTLNFEPIRQQ